MLVSRRLATAVAAVAATAWLAGPRVAAACAVCFGGEGSDWTGGFLLGTTLMLLLPPLIIGGAAFAIYRAIKKQEARIRERDELAARRAAGPQPVPRPAR